MREPRKLLVVLSPEEVRRLLDALVAEKHGRPPPIASAKRPKTQAKSRIKIKNLAPDVSSAQLKTPEFRRFQTPPTSELLKMGMTFAGGASHVRSQGCTGRNRVLSGDRLGNVRRRETLRLCSL